MRVWLILVLFCLVGCASSPDEAVEDECSDDCGEGQIEPPAEELEDETEDETEPDPDPAPMRDAVTWDVDISGSDFIEGSLTIQVGDTVRWTQKDSAPHTVTADNGEFDSSNGITNRMTTTANSVYAFEFAALGEFPYHCEVHPSMTDVITVLERSDATPA